MNDGWSESADAWIAEMGERGDYGRAFVLDAPMLARACAAPRALALDVGCGEGRFCRMLQSRGIPTIGIDPTEALLRCARDRDASGDYRLARAEALPFDDATFDLTVSYLTLIDIDDVEAAIGEMARVLRPGGTLLVANLTSHATAAVGGGWRRGADGREHFEIDDYLTERAAWATWRGIRIRNWHRPLERYVSAFLGSGLRLRHFAEPAPTGGDPARAERYRRVPYFLVMEWEKPIW